ncbi:class I adenylate-forming enzyme family protein [Ottowia thiooxydans]|uniref:Long-chain acyl-CoA synthetase n=1 Tax=Ottowia thiooxydans TaxID=219182 RepID=A0ABV2Q460_9BURK
MTHVNTERIVKYSVDDEFALLADLIRQHAVTTPLKLAITDDTEVPHELTYADLDAQMDRVASRLTTAGLQAGSTIAICAKSSSAYASIFLGALRAGIAVAPLPPSATTSTLTKMLVDSEAKLVFLDSDGNAALPQQAPGHPMRVALDACPGLLTMEAWLHSAASGIALGRTVDADSAFNIIYSSGTTGEPKGVVQSHRMRWAHIQRARRYKYSATSVTLLSTPLYSNTTLVAFFPALAFGGTVVLMSKFDTGKYLALCEAHRATHTMLVPVQYLRLMQHEGFGQHNLSTFVMKLCSSAPFPAALKSEVLARWPGGLTEIYGMTEGGGSCLLEADVYPGKLHTVGRPAPGSEFRVISEGGTEVPEGSLGEIVGRSKGMMTGYHGRPGLTSESEWFDQEGRRYIRTGDLGRFDEDGFLILVDRIKDLLISGGFNVYPRDLEDILHQHTDISEAAVTGIPSEEWGESPAAFVVLKPFGNATPADLMRWVNNQVGKTQRLVSVTLLKELPRNAIGKVLKRELRQLARLERP